LQFIYKFSFHIALIIFQLYLPAATGTFGKFFFQLLKKKPETFFTVNIFFTFTEEVQVRSVYDQEFHLKI